VLILLATFPMVCLTRLTWLLNSRLPAYGLGCLAKAIKIADAVLILQNKNAGFWVAFVHIAA